MIATLADGRKVDLQIDGVEYRCTRHGQHWEDGVRVIRVIGEIVLDGKTREEKDAALKAALAPAVVEVRR